MKTLKRHLLIAITVLTVSACSSNGIHEKIEQIEVAHQKQVDKKPRKWTNSLIVFQIGT